MLHATAFAVMGLNAVIPAGGAGTRLWPRSRNAQPKHLLALHPSGIPLLRQTFLRVRPLVDDIYIVTEQRQVSAIREVIPELDEDHIIVEPTARGTTSALGLAAMTIAKRDPEAIMLSIPADHVIGDERRYRATLRRLVKLATQSSKLVTVGLTPYYAATGFGYLRTDSEVRYDGVAGLQVVEFVEKPSFDRATLYLAQGSYYWNLAIFCWRIETFLAELKRHSPTHHTLLNEALSRRAAGDEEGASAVYDALPRDAVDYTIMEKTDQLLLLPARFHWIDVGSWSELHAILPKDDAGNAVAGDHVLIDSESSLFHVPGKLVAAIGVKDLVVVESGNALLICPRSRAQEVKSVVERLRVGALAHYV